MPKMEWIRPRQTVRPRSTGRVPVLLCLLVAGLTALVVYRWGRENWLPVRAKPTYTATVYVVSHKAATAGRADLSATAGRADLPGSTYGETRVPLTYTNADSQRATEAAEAMAELYLCDRRTEWRRRMEGPLLEARRSVEQARGERDASVARLETFEHKLREAAAEEQSAITGEKPGQSSITNPRWLDLERQSAALIRRREELLVDRTHLHPVVREVSDQIVEIERRMAKIPRVVKGDRSDLPRSGPEAGTMLAWSLHKSDLSPFDLAELTAAVDKTRQVYEAAKLAEQQAEQRMEAEPQYSIQRGRVVENPPPVDYRWRRLMWTTLVAGAMMAFGAGSLSLGAGIEPPVASAAEVRATSGESVIGTVPADDPAPDMANIARQWRIRRTSIAVGLLLMVACPIVAVWGVLGI